jgi:SAM-dependent methyltransferase
MTYSDINAWLQTPSGQYLLAWEQAQFDERVADVFGYHALQLGLAPLAALQANRMPQRWLAVQQQKDLAHLTTDSSLLLTQFESLPFDSQSLDLIVLPHTLELSADPHQLLREAERVLRPEGRLLVSAFNPWSLWGARQKIGHWTGYQFLPEVRGMISLPRLKDWLKLLNFELQGGRFGCYRPPCHSDKRMARSSFFDRAGDRWWPILGAVYILVAVKRVAGMRLIGPSWKQKTQSVSATAPIANASIFPTHVELQRGTHE